MADCFLAGVIRAIRTRRSDNGNSRPAQSIITPFYTSNITSHSNLQCNLEQGLNEVKDIKDQLQKLRDIVEQESVRAEDETKESLIRENDALRRQLIEQDNIIKALKQQIALLKST
ncbi:unnamed protein product [Auanema sp. JU1783]|nr:unnamed protein product [Auanema sp. JU1783]